MNITSLASSKTQWTQTRSLQGSKDGSVGEVIIFKLALVNILNFQYLLKV